MRDKKKDDSFKSIDYDFDELDIKSGATTGVAQEEGDEN